MFDEAVLDVPEALARADSRDLLRGAARAGARVRTAVRQAAAAGLTGLRPEGRPRAVLVAGSGPAASCAADLLGALAEGAVPVTALRPTGRLAAPGALRWSLPGWAGPLDLLLVVTADGTEGGLTALVDQAYRRGCTVVAVAPEAAPLAAAIGDTRGLSVPLAPAATPVPYASHGTPEVYGPGTESQGGDPLDIPRTPEPPLPLPAAPGTLWALLTPCLLLCDRLGLFTAGEPALQSLADRLDAVAERCGPAVETYANPGKSLATELSGTLPLLWSEGAVAGAAARNAATALTVLSGRPALAAELPEAMSLHGSLLGGEFGPATGGDSFFRDRVDDPESLHARIVLLNEQGAVSEPATVAAQEMARTRDIPVSRLEPADDSSPLEAAAEMIATADFAAVYLLLATHDA